MSMCDPESNSCASDGVTCLPCPSVDSTCRHAPAGFTGPSTSGSNCACTCPAAIPTPSNVVDWQTNTITYKPFTLSWNRTNWQQGPLFGCQELGPLCRHDATSAIGGAITSKSAFELPSNRDGYTLQPGRYRVTNLFTTGTTLAQQWALVLCDKPQTDPNVPFSNCQQITTPTESSPGSLSLDWEFTISSCGMLGQTNSRNHWDYFTTEYTLVRLGNLGSS